jgi:hypothetical protein
MMRCGCINRGNREDRGKAREADVQSDITVRSIDQYVKCVTSISSSWGDEESFIAPWFRGIGNSEKFKLLPRLYREPDIDHLKEEFKIRVAFSSRALQYVTSAYKREPWDWYFLMQHYGVPTRLLDWTESALVALYFALDSRKAEQRSFPAVWVLDPFALNAITRGASDIVVPSEVGLGAHLPMGGSDVQAQLPVAVHPEYTDRRMSAQHSKFTMHGRVPIPLEEMTELQVLLEKERLVRILIDAANDEAADGLKQSLALLGIRNSTVFPDLTGLAMDIRQDYTPMRE